MCTHTRTHSTTIPAILLHPHTKAMVRTALSSLFPAPRHIVHYQPVTVVQLFWLFHLYATGNSSNKWKGALSLLKSACVCGFMWVGNDGSKKVWDGWHGRWECFHVVTRNSTKIQCRVAGGITHGKDMRKGGPISFSEQSVLLCLLRPPLEIGLSVTLVVSSTAGMLWFSEDQDRWADKHTARVG